MPKQTPKPGLDLPKSVRDSLYQVYPLLNKDSRHRLELTVEIPVFIKDPVVAQEEPVLGVQEVVVRLEAGLGNGPTSARAVVVDYNADQRTLNPPVTWDREARQFRSPVSDPAFALPQAPTAVDVMRYIGMSAKRKAELKKEYQEFIQKAIANPFFHQLNAWAIVQHVLDFYEESQAMGRPIPWGFEGNRLLIIPHAGYKENAFSDRGSKSLQLYYFGDATNPGYTCLSHDIIAHETGHAILDGIRPYYLQPSSVQTSAFHEFIGDLTALLVALFNKDLRHFIADKTEGKIGQANVLADLARQFGEEVSGRRYLRTALNKETMDSVSGSTSPHNVSQVLTGAMFEILMGLTQNHLDRNLPPAGAAGGAAPARPAGDDQVTPREAFWRAADRLRRVALQPLDLCPPCDIQFLDYARAVVRNDILTNPIDEDGYRKIILDVFHRRGLCRCGYAKDKPVSEECLFYEVLSEFMFKPKIDMVFHDIEHIARSRTAAYYYLNDNRRALRIPPNVDMAVVDLYDTNKQGAAAERLPREVVLEYLWEEGVTLEDEPGKRSYGSLNGKTIGMLCGGTLVFDGRGNLLSWFNKPGTEHMDATTEVANMERMKAWKKDPEQARADGFKKLTHQEQAELGDRLTGRARVEALRDHIANLVSQGLVGQAQPANALFDGMSPLVAVEQGGLLHFEQAAHLGDFDFDKEAPGWKVNY